MDCKHSTKTRRCSTTKSLPVVHIKCESFHLCLPIIQKSLTQFSSVLNCDYMKNYEAQFVYIFGGMLIAAQDEKQNKHLFPFNR